MNNPFKILAGFLHKHGNEVEGRCLEAPPAHVKTQARDFVRGTLAKPEQDQFFQILKDKPQWITVLAEEARSSGAEKSPRPQKPRA